jgi:hypothetical protein
VQIKEQIAEAITAALCIQNDLTMRIGRPSDPQEFERVYAAAVAIYCAKLQRAPK